MIAVELCRVPSRQYAQARPEYRPTVNRYDYTTPDGRWYVEKNRGCGGGWAVIDTTGRYVCTGCFYNDNGHTAIVRTLSAVRAFVCEWST